MKRIPKLYNARQKVRASYYDWEIKAVYNVEAVVIEPVYKSDNLPCPHCGTRNKIYAGLNSDWGYYLDIPHHRGCCKPFRPHELYAHHDVNSQSFSSFIDELKYRR